MLLSSNYTLERISKEDEISLSKRYVSLFVIEMTLLTSTKIWNLLILPSVNKWINTVV